MPSDDVKVAGVPNLYRRGRQYVGRVNFDDDLGRRAYRKVALATTDKNEAIARLAKLTGQVKVDHNVPAARSRKVTVEQFLTEYWVPHKQQQILAGRFEESTLARYQQDLRLRVIPLMGHLPVLAVTSDMAEKFLIRCWTGGPDAASRGRKPTHDPGVYALVRRCRTTTPPMSYADIALLASHRFPAEAGITKHAVARIWARMGEADAKQTRHQTPNRRLSDASVEKIRQMLQGAWRWGMTKCEPKMVDRNVWAEAEVPRAGKALKPPRSKLWQPDHYQAFFTWARAENLRLWPAWMFTAETGDRRGGNLGVHWDAVDLDQQCCHLTFFVEQIKHRIVVRDYGKTNGGQKNIPFTHHVAEALRHQKARQAAERLRVSVVHVCPSIEPYCPEEGYHDRGLVFSQRNGEYLNPDRFTRELQRAIVRYNLKHDDQLPVIDIHTMRHGWSSAADAVGVPESMRMKHLGQNSAKVNRLYTEVFDTAERAAQEAIGDYLLG